MSKIAKSILRTSWFEQLPVPQSIAKKLRRRRAKHLSALKQNPYCGLCKGRVTVADCLKNQFQKGCLGCSAGSHLCHRCGVRPVHFTDLEFCRFCLPVALKQQLILLTKNLPIEYITLCSQTKLPITFAECLSIQQNGQCRRCRVPSRLCESCRLLPARYPEYQRCLICQLGKDRLAELLSSAPKKQADKILRFCLAFSLTQN